MKLPRPGKSKLPGKTHRHSLRLYVAGRLPRSLEAIERLREICAEAGANAPTVEIVDMLAEPEQSLADGIIVTPTLLRVWPKPALLILGALTDTAQVRAALELDAPNSSRP